MGPIQTVAVLGASGNPERYSYLALKLLQEKGHRVFPVNPALGDLEGLAVAKSLQDLVEPVDTLTIYVGAARLPAMADEIVRLKPGRVIFNPGTESPELQSKLDAAGIPWVEACTLVMLRSGQF
jgi:predicted CoA-binding protein